MRKFKLARIGDYHSIAPSTGEELGELIAKLAAEQMERYIASPTAKVEWWGDRIAQLFHLAADAYEAGAAVTIGHNRSDRYLAAADRHRKMAETLTQQAKLFRDQSESERLLKAFDDGFHGRDLKRHAFEMREAALVGKLFAEAGEKRPKKINKIWTGRPLTKDSPPDHLLVDDIKYIVIYPEGKVDRAFAKPIA